MAAPAPRDLYYSRCRFTTRLPAGRLYAPAHLWVERQDDGLWRVGFTRFATRMLGELVEYEFSLAPGELAARGDEIGWVEGFKAVSALYAVMDGEFAGPNPALEEDLGLVNTAPYRQGWLYRMSGEPGNDLVDVHSYAALLDATIDRMLGEMQDYDCKGP